jgi:hypothetical protein
MTAAEGRERARLRSQYWRRAHGIMPRRPASKPEAAFSAASFARASALAAVRAARSASPCHAAVIYCVNRPNGSASSFVSGL